MATNRQITSPKAASCGCSCDCGCDGPAGVCPATGGASTSGACPSVLPGASGINYTSTSNGDNWTSPNDPYVCTDNGITFVYFDACKMYQFSGSGTTFAGSAGVVAPVALTFDTSICQYVFTDCSGSQYYFTMYGAFDKVVMVNGTQTQVQSADSGNSDGSPDFSRAARRLGQQSAAMVNYTYSDIQQTITNSDTGDVTITSTLSASYALGPNAGQVAGVVLRRQVNGGAWIEMEQVLYDYYGNNDPFGTPRDIRTITSQVMQGTQWVTTTTTAYRYYTSTGPTGFVHGLKFVLEDEAYRRLSADPAVSDPLLASDSLLAQYADNYYEYDGSQRVTKSVTNGGLYTYLYAYAVSPFSPTTDYNVWNHKTTITRPDGVQEIYYVNFVNQIMLHVVDDGTNKWIDYHQFNANAQETLTAFPSAVANYAESDRHLGVVPGTGLVQFTAYYDSTTASSTPGGVTGYLEADFVQQTWDNSVIPATVPASDATVTHLVDYKAQTAGNVTIYWVANDIVFSGDLGSNPIITSYDNLYFGGTNQIQQQTINLPVVPSGQNGTGSVDTVTNIFDALGNLIWNRGPRGFISNNAYDLVLGVVTQSIQDVDGELVQLPAGWTTPAGGGLHLVTDYEYDNESRLTQVLGPEHNVDGQTVRKANWTVYHDDTRETWSAQGFAVGTQTLNTGTSYSCTLLGPVSISRVDQPVGTSDSIQAVRASGSEGPLSPSDSFPQCTWCRWSSTLLNDAGQSIAAQVYFDIPDCGQGYAGTNYNETLYGYDGMGRQNRVVSPGGTITRTVFDSNGRTVATFVGTSDNGATDADPTGGHAAGNNMVQTVANVYDDGGVGDGNLTSQTAYVDGGGTNDRTTQFGYDFRDRQFFTTDATGRFTSNTFDNLGRVTRVAMYASPDLAHLLTRSDTAYDNRGRVYQTTQWGVDPVSGALGNNLVSNAYYDQAGNVIESLPAGSQAFTKMTYDGLGRQIAKYAGYTPGSPSAAGGPIVDDLIFEQTLTTYDEASNVILTTGYQRFHDATGFGQLNGPSGPQPAARVTYMASWFDGIGRTEASANYGTNGNVPLTRPDSAPASSATVLVSTTAYNARGEAYLNSDPAGKVMRADFDDAGRGIRTTDKYVSPGPCSACGEAAVCGCDLGTYCPPQAGNDQNVIVETTFTADGQVQTLTAKNPVTGDQTTTYQYGTTLSTSSIARNDLVVAEIYPNAADAADQVSYTYNRQGQRVAKRDQNGTVHAYGYDPLGHQTADRITTLAAGVDGSVRQIGVTYEIHGLVERITSYADTAGATVVNEVQNVYNGFQQLARQYQEHGGAVNVSMPPTTPFVQYDYEGGSFNTIRPISITYPNGRLLNYIYNSGDDDALSRVSGLGDSSSSSPLVAYTYLGLGSFVQADYQQPGVRWDLATGSGSNPYVGLDQFGRVIDNLWYKHTGATGTLDQVLYTYDQAGNRTSRQNSVATAAGAMFDELYAYDGMHRLKTFNRGTLDETNDRLTALTFKQGWQLDATGNWTELQQLDQNDSTQALDQQRINGTFNEIVDFNATVGPIWVTPEYDRNGNMIAMPQPEALTSGYAATFDAWDRLVQLTNATTSAPVSSMRYDGQNWRISKTVSGTPRHYYYRSQWQDLEERIGSTPNSTVAERQFVWGLRYIDDLVLRDRVALSERLFALQDANWNMDAIVSSAGAVLERYCYTAYGTPTVLDPNFAVRSAGSDSDWETRYVGYRWDTESGLYPVRWRWLHAQLGRWLTVDLLRNLRTQLYAYVVGRPLVRRDWSGLDDEIDLIEDEVSTAGISLACARLAHSIISNQIKAARQLQRNKNGYYDQTVRVIGRDEGNRNPTKCVSSRRPDVVLTDGRGNGSVYEIKPDTPYGHTQGPIQARQYRDLLNKPCCLNITLGSQVPPATPGTAADPDCGTLNWTFTSPAMIYYTWTPCPNYTVLTVAYSAAAAAVAAAEYLARKAAQGTTVTVEVLEETISAIPLFICVTCLAFDPDQGA